MKGITAIFAAALAALPAGDTATLDFAAQKLPAGWSIAAGAWKVEQGELRGAGDGALEFVGPIGPDFRLAFAAQSAEKANIEVKLFDAATGEELWTFAFLGRYHSVLDGVKSCLLQGGRFVAVDPRTWIFPGRRFRFEVRAAKGQLQMFLDGALGPFFVDPAPREAKHGLRLRILASTEGSKDAVVLDDVVLEHVLVKP